MKTKTKKIVGEILGTIFVLFLLIPLLYGGTCMVLDSWREILPYSWTHSFVGCSHKGHHHIYHTIGDGYEIR